MRKDEENKPASLETLNKHLAEVKQFNPESTQPKKLPGDAARSAIDFASATAVGSILGYAFDAWQDTMPWGLLAGLFLGVATGMKLMFQNEARERAKAEAEKEKQG
jgi:F0F1-type ATP synthase assembly protein I